MAAGDLQRRQQERGNRRAAGGGGINNANVNGSRIPNAQDRAAEGRILATAAKRNAATEAGYNPRDYGYDENFNKTGSGTRSATNNTNPSMSAAEAKSRRTEMYENDKRSRMGQPLVGRGITSSTLDGDPSKVGPTPTPTPTPTVAPGAGGTAPGTGNRIPTLLQPNAGQIRGKINGEDAGAVLKRMRGEAVDRANKLTDPAAREAAMPFGASKSERDYDAGLARNKEAADRDAAAAAAAKTPPSPGVPAKPDAVATPTTPSPKPGDVAKPGTPPAAPTAPSPGASSGAESSPNALALVNTVMTPIRAARGAAGARMLGVTGDINQAKSIYQSAQGMTNKAMSLVDEMKQGAGRISGMAQQSARLADDAAHVANIERLTKGWPSSTTMAAEDAANIRAGVLGENANRTGNLMRNTQLPMKNLVAQEAKAAQVLKEAKNVAKTPLNRLAAAIAPTVKAAAPGLLRRGTGMVMRKLGPMIDAVNTTRYAYNKLTGDEEQEAALNTRAKELLDKGDLGGAGSVYNLMPATYAGGGRTAFEADARIKAKDMAVDERDKRAAAGDKEMLQALIHERRRQQTLTELGHNAETLKTLPIKERLAIMKKARDQARR